MSRANPFLTDTNPITGDPMGATTAADRIKMVRGFSRDQCNQARQLPDLAVTVQAAVAKRVRELERQRAREWRDSGIHRMGTG